MKVGDTFMFRGLKLHADHADVKAGQCVNCLGHQDGLACGELPSCLSPRVLFKPIIDHEPTHDRLAYLLLTNQLDWKRTETNVAFEHPATQSSGSPEPRHEGG